jgi:predicted Zn-dependent peptidase
MPELSDLGASQPALDVRETLWSMGQRSRSFQELRKDARHAWDDEAARDINSRHLNPHEETDRNMRASLELQSEALLQAHEQLVIAQQLAAEVDACSIFITEKLRFAQQDMDSSYSNYDVYVHYNAESKSKFPQVRELIDCANAACE